ncbi:MAG: carboxypeptidase regulatory-like domain-containing protein [Candidatus Sumerlaeota bacterium]|nr:carboxypeptidase regulatory-like domain-containing protein [Candidatus Sumerlaeota bacterium]
MPNVAPASKSRLPLYALLAAAALCALFLLPRHEDESSSPQDESKSRASGRTPRGGHSGLPGAGGAAPASNPSRLPPTETKIVLPSLVGKVTRKSNAQPIPGATLSITSAGSAKAATDAEGAYRIEHLRPGAVRIKVRADGFVPQPDRMISIRSDKPETAADFVLTRAARIEGRVVDEQGGPVAGAQVWIVDQIPVLPQEYVKPIGQDVMRILDNPDSGLSKLVGPEMKKHEETAAPVQTDGDGRFVFPWAPVGKPIALRAAHPAFAPSATEAQSLAEEEVRSDVVITLRRGAGIAGHILTPDGAPIPGARVSAIATGPTPAGMIRSIADGLALFAARQIKDAAIADESGAYRLEHITPARYRVLAEADGFQYNSSAEVEVAENAQVEGIDIVLQPAAVLQGHVYDAKNSPIAGAFVLTVLTNLEHPDFDLATTDANGRYQLAHLKPNMIHWVAAWADGYGWKLESMVFVPRKEDLDFHLELDASVSGVVVDAVTGAPIPQFRIFPLPENMPMQIYFILAAKVLAQGINPSIPFQDSEGRFMIDRLAAGDYKFSASADGYVQADKEIAGLQPDEARQDVRIELSPGAGVQGVVVEAGEGGKPIAGARVIPNPMTNPLGFQRMLDPLEEAITDADGRFYLAGLPAEKPTQLFAQAAGYLPGQANATASLTELKEVRIELARAATITGRVIDGTTNQPVANATIVQGGGGLGATFQRDWQQGPPSSTQTAADGRFVFTEARPGTERLTVRHPDYPECVTDLFTVRSDGPTDVGDIPLLASGRVEGHVYGPDQAPISGASIILTIGSADHPTTTDYQGFYHYDHVPPGTHQVLLVEKVDIGPGGLQGSGAQNVRQADVAAGQTATVDFILFPGARLYGTVLAGDKPAKGKFVLTARAAEAERGTRQDFTGATSDNGAYEIRDLPPGDYELIVSNSGGFRRTAILTERIAIAGQDMQHDVRLPQSSISGVVVDPDGKPVADARVEFTGVQTPMGTRAPSARTDKKGAFTLTPVEPGDYTLVARHPNFGYATATTTVAEGQSVTDLRFQLPSKVPLTGKALLAQLNPPGPVTQLYVRLVDANGAVVLNQNVGVNREGVYAIQSLIPGVYQLDAFTASFSFNGPKLEAAPIHEDAVDVHGDPHDLLFYPGATVRVLTVDSAGQPLPFANLKLARPDGGLVIFPCIVPGPEYTRTDDKGFFQFDHAPAGEHTLTASKDGYEFDSRSISPAPGQALDIGLTLKPLATPTP